jgi:hypothetical protein
MTHNITASLGTASKIMNLSSNFLVHMTYALPQGNTVGNIAQNAVAAYGIIGAVNLQGFFMLGP